MKNTKIDAVAAHPYHQYLDLENLCTEQGKGSLSMTVNEQHINPAGVLHGGVVYSVLDVVSYIALLSQLAPEQDAATHDIHVSVMRPSREADVVEFSAEVEKLGRSLAFITAKAQVKGKTIATARVTKSILS